MADKKIRDGVWRCKGGFHAVHNGAKLIVPGGALIPHDLDYDVMDGRESLFVAVDIPAPPRPSRTGKKAKVEQATAAPGEVRDA